MALERKHGKLHVRLATSERKRDEIWASVESSSKREMRNIIIIPIALSGKLTHNEMKMRWCGSFRASSSELLLHFADCSLPVHTSMTLESSRCMALGKFILLRILERFVFDEIFLFAP
jgi:hypothetical protein